MAEPPPLSVEEALAEEYQALRPEADLGRGQGLDPGLFQRVHAFAQPLAALCISGGGIRSATFGLGALQGLAERGILGQMDYLSTVSGGGYIGSWLTAWKHRQGGLEAVLPKLRRNAPEPRPGEPNPIRHLREYNSYLSPRRGGLSPDVWTLVATVARNILLNWLVLVPLLLCALMVPRLVVALLAFPELLYGSAIFPAAGTGGGPDYGAPVLDAISHSPWVAVALPVASALLFGATLFNILRCLPGLGNAPHTHSAYRRRILAPLLGAVLSFLAFDSLYYLGSKFRNTSNLGSVLLWTVLPAAGAWLLYLLFSRRSWRSRLGLLFGPLSLAMVFMAAGVGAAAWVSTNFLLWSPNPDAQTSWAEYVTFGPPVVLLGFCFGTALYLGLSSGFLRDQDREWMSRALAGVLLVSAGWALFSGLLLVVPHYVLAWKGWEHGLLGALGVVAGWLSSWGRNVAQKSKEGEAAAEKRSRTLSIALAAAPVLFLAVLVVGLSLLTDLLLEGVHQLFGEGLHGPHGQVVSAADHYGVLTRSHPLLLLAATLGLLVIAWLMARYIDINTFSLHGMYRDRLIRAYLGASNRDRDVNPFTGFAPNDDLPMAQLDPTARPFHVVNLTLNLVATDRLDWQQRKAEAFTVTPLASGAAGLGYRPSASYGGDDGISLGTAFALSGAAASPSMGYHSSALIGFIMTLFNARLGAWLGNPGPAGERTWRHFGPRSAVSSLVREAFGLTSNQGDYVYLSDGGHFENLGLYEMVRRRCRFIVVLDSGADPDLAFDDLGNALRKVRIDLRIPIEVDSEQLKAVVERRRRAATARILYSVVDGSCEDGQLLYIKPTRLGSEPPDVESYAKANPTFPHQTTADQWFDESQTESYRMLGLHSIDEICHGWEGGELASLFDTLAPTSDQEAEAERAAPSTG